MMLIGYTVYTKVGTLVEYMVLSSDSDYATVPSVQGMLTCVFTRRHMC